MAEKVNSGLYNLASAVVREGLRFENRQLLDLLRIVEFRAETLRAPYGARDIPLFFSRRSLTSI